MVLGLVLTVGVSAVTSPSFEEDSSVYFEGIRAD
jgi:hypothetical protein